MTARRRPRFTPYLTPVDGESADDNAMSDVEFNRLLEKLGLTQMAAARLLGVNARSVRRWAAGEADVLPTAARFLRFLAAAKIAPLRVMETLAS